MCTGAEENAKKLYTAAYSLLLMHDVLQSKAGGAFLKVQTPTQRPYWASALCRCHYMIHLGLATVQVLVHLQKGSPEHLLSAYGEWFREIASSGHTSWQDYLLDEVSRPFAYCMTMSHINT